MLCQLLWNMVVSNSHDKYLGINTNKRSRLLSGPRNGIFDHCGFVFFPSHLYAFMICHNCAQYVSIGNLQGVRGGGGKAITPIPSSVSQHPECAGNQTRRGDSHATHFPLFAFLLYLIFHRVPKSSPGQGCTHPTSLPSWSLQPLRRHAWAPLLLHSCSILENTDHHHSFIYLLFCCLL